MRTHNQLTLAWLLCALLAACGDGKDEATPPRDSGGPGFTDEDADVVVETDGGEELDGGTDTDAAVDSDAAQDSDAGSCSGKDGCYSCKPETNLQLLNSCADGCRKFDVKSYPSDWKPGQPLPALP